MSKAWLKEVFGTPKPVIAMAHLPALPGAPLYDRSQGMAGVVAALVRDLSRLQAGGVDGIMFCNENDRPYELHVPTEGVAAMAYAIGVVRSELHVPFGVDLLWDPVASVALAHAVGARFVREVFTGLYSSDMGLWQGAAAEALRLRAQLGDNHQVRLLFNTSAEFASPLGGRSAAKTAKSVAFSSLPDAICVSGTMTGEAVEMDGLAEVVAEVSETPVFVNTGVNAGTIGRYLELADGVIVGTALKVDGHTFNPVDESRVRTLMAAAEKARSAVRA